MNYRTSIAMNVRVWLNEAAKWRNSRNSYASFLNNLKIIVEGFRELLIVFTREGGNS